MAQHPYNGGKGAPDPQQYILVHTKEGIFYRRRRGKVKPALLNDACRQRADGMKLSSPAAKRLRMCLSPLFRGLTVGRVNAGFGEQLKQAFLLKGRFDFSFFTGYEFQKEHPLDSLLLVPYTVRVDGGAVWVRIPPDAKAVKAKSGLVSHYYFDLVLVSGDAGHDDGLSVDCVSSALFAFDTRYEQGCQLSLSLPEGGEPWMLLLKISCLEGNELAYHPRHYGMRVVAAG